VKIADIRLRSFKIPLKSELRWGEKKSLAALEHLLVEVELQGGAVGRGEVAVRPTIYGETAASVRGAVSWLRPLLLGSDAGDPRALAQTLARLPCNLAAKAALEMAAREAAARRRGLTLAETLPRGRERVRVSFIVGQGGVAATLESAAFAYAHGVRVFKLKTGKDAALDEERIRELTAAFTDAEVYADANETLEPSSAAHRLERWRSLGVTMVEEPLPVEMISARKALRAARLLPLIADDSAFTPRDLERELEQDTFDILNVKPARSGFYGSLKMLERAHSAGKEAMIGSQAMSSFGAARAALLAFHPAISRPSELSFHLLSSGGFSDFPQIKDGWLYYHDLARAAFDEEAFRSFET